MPFLLAISTASISWSQSLEVGVGAGIAILKSATLYTDPIPDGGYGFGPTEPSYQMIAKYPLHVNRMIILAGITYVPLSSNATIASSGDDFRYPGYGTLSGITYHASMMSILVGVEWFLHKEGSGPYFGTHVLILSLSSINVEKRFAYGTVAEKIDGWPLFDVGIHAGYSIPLTPIFVLEVGGHYNLGWIMEQYDAPRGLNAFGADVRVLFALQ